MRPRSNENLLLSIHHPKSTIQNTASPDWRRLLAGAEQPVAAATDSRRRLRWMFAAFVLLISVVLARLWALEVTTGARVRSQASQPLMRVVSLTAPRGRIVTRDGTVLAHDRKLHSLQLHYRHLEEPPDADWLTYQARRQLSADERRDPQQIAAAAARVRIARAEMHRRLAALSGLSPTDYDAARRRIQQRVERVARDVNARHAAKLVTQQQPVREGFWGWLCEQLFTPADAGAPQRIIIAEELEYHAVFEDLSPASEAKIAAQPELYPGVRIEIEHGRDYPHGALAAHLVGHLGAVSEKELARAARWSDSPQYKPNDQIGRMGVELAHEAQLRGRRGTQQEQIDRRGETLEARVLQAPQSGDDVVLTLDAALQQSAERLLDSALARRDLHGDQHLSAGGAVVMLDCHTGEVLVLASAPRFDPNVLLRGPSSAIHALLNGDDNPLFDRATKMAIPPGSVMKAFTAVALLESGVVEPRTPFYCQGYLHHPSRQRCAIFRHFGLGHEQIDLARALAESCNVYFFHHARRLGPERLVNWAQRFGLGASTGIDLPHEAAGRLPTPATIEQLEGRAWRTSDTQALSIGQSLLTTTPLQIARAMAAIANGGRLVTPHVHVGAGSPPAPIAGLHAETLAAVRRGLERAVFDADGTAHETLFLEAVPIAAKTGTAETGGGQPDHAWLAGYAPADAPRIAFAVALEHAGGGGEAAGPLMRRLIGRLEQLGY